MSSRDSGATGRLWTRRGLAGAGVLAMLGGCGLRPIYASKADGTASAAAQGLAAITVAVIPDRHGQLLRQALQARFDRGGGGVAKRYDLAVNFGFSAEALDIEQATSVPTRLRLVGLANWSLVSEDAQRKTLASGTARVMDGLNLYDQQFFAQDEETEAVERRVAEAVADEMTLQLAAWFNRQAAG